MGFSAMISELDEVIDMLQVCFDWDPLGDNPNEGIQTKDPLVNYLNPRASTQPIQVPCYPEFIHKVLPREDPRVDNVKDYCCHS